MTAASDPAVGDVFPSLGRLATSEDARTLARLPFEAGDPLALSNVGALVELLAAEGEVSADALADSIDELLVDATAVLGESARMTDALAFTTATIAAETLQDRGDFVSTAIFLQKAIAADSAGAWNVRPERLTLWKLDDGSTDVELLGVTLRFYAVVFGDARSRPERNEVAENLSPRASWAIAAVLERVEGDYSEDLFSLAVGAAIHQLEWAIHAGYGDPRAQFRPWVSVIDAPWLSRRVREMLLGFAAFSEFEVTDRPQEYWARILLRDYAGDLTPPVELRALCSACGGRLDELLVRLPAIIASAAAHRDFDRSTDSVVERAYRRSSDHRAVAWALRTLVQERHSEEALRLLRAWKPSPPNGEIPTSPLFVLETSVVGTLWASPSSVRPNPAGAWPNTLDAMFSSIERTFSTALEVKSDQSWDATEDFIGAPVLSEAASFEATSVQHLRLDALAEMVQAIPEDAVLIPWPMMRIPLQALVLRETERVWPICASLARPLTERRPLNVVVMGGGSLTSEMEREAVRDRLTRAGMHVEVVDTTTRETFQVAYNDPRFDVIWLCGHGEEDLVRPHRSGLELDGQDRMTLNELSQLVSPQGQRRLLVLNVCSGGASPMLEGSPALSPAAVLAGPSQTVISHQWPVDQFVAAAFGGALADALAIETGHLAVFSRALSRLRDGREGISVSLRDAGLGDLADRMEYNGAGWGTILAWGSPIMVV